MRALIFFWFCTTPALCFSEIIRLNCLMLHDQAISHSYTVDTTKNVVVTDAGPPIGAVITESVISFTHKNNDSGAVWSHVIQRQNGLMTIIDMNSANKIAIKLRCDRVVRNKF
jgi:hypothetical protein